MSVTCDLYSQWIQAIRHELTSLGFDHSSIADQNCAIRWHSWKRRVVSPGNRVIRKAANFNCPPHLSAGLTDLDNAFATGGDIRLWQSKAVDNVEFEDGMYNDYGVLHFHLGQGLDSSGYINRTRELLFAVVQPGAVHEIGIFNHGDWFELDILNIIDTNWPDLLDRVTLRGFSGNACPSVTREQVKALRTAHMIGVFQLAASGRIVAPFGGGAATDGTSCEAVCTADFWARNFKNWEKVISAFIAKQVQSGNLEDKDYHVLLHCSDDEIAVDICGMDRGMAVSQCRWTLWKRP